MLIADSVGLGKTWIGKKLLEDTAYHRRQKALVVCPASLREMWQHELQEAAISAAVVSQELLGREDFEVRPYRDVDVILIDESHNFRNPHTQRYGNLERLIGANGGRGRDGARKKVIMLTATPINNTIFDLYHQLMLFTQGDRAYFSGTGIGDLRRFFVAARKAANGVVPGEGGPALRAETTAVFNLLEEIAIRRTRPFIRQAYPRATIRGVEIRWPTRRLRRVSYNLECTYAGIYDAVVAGIEALHLTPYNLEDYKRTDLPRDEFALGRQAALVGIFKSRYLKRFESSVAAFRISIRRALAFLRAFEAWLDEGRLLDSATFQEALRFLEREAEEDDVAVETADPTALADALATSKWPTQLLQAPAELDHDLYDRAASGRTSPRTSVASRIWDRIVDISPERDARLQEVGASCATTCAGRGAAPSPTIAIPPATSTGHWPRTTCSHAAGARAVGRMDGGVAPDDRAQRVAQFAPFANERPELAGA